MTFFDCSLGVRHWAPLLVSPVRFFLAGSDFLLSFKPSVQFSFLQSSNSQIVSSPEDHVFLHSLMTGECDAKSMCSGTEQPGFKS